MKMGLIYLYKKKPYLNTHYFDTKYLIGEIDKDSFPEITFENSPQEVEIILPQIHNKVWHDIDEEPIYENGVTPIIIDSNYEHISQEGHYYNQVQWKSHIEFQKHREFKWAYEKDLMNL